MKKLWLVMFILFVSGIGMFLLIPTLSPDSKWLDECPDFRKFEPTTLGIYVEFAGSCFHSFDYDKVHDVVVKSGVALDWDNGEVFNTTRPHMYGLEQDFRSFQMLKVEGRSSETLFLDFDAIRNYAGTLAGENVSVLVQLHGFVDETEITITWVENARHR